MKRPVGILGGMGPEATIDLMMRVMAAVDAGDDADHIPLIVHQNTQVPSRIAALIDGDGADPGPVLAGMARDLERAGAVALAMPCNTAHHYADQIRAATDLPFLDMVALAAVRGRELARGGRLGILGSPALARTGVYDKALAAEGLEAVYPADADATLRLIRRVKAQGATDAARDEIRGLAASLTDQGADAICVACTEFSLLTNALTGQPVAVFDALDLLVDAISAASAQQDEAVSIRPQASLHGDVQRPNELRSLTKTGGLS